VKDHLNNPISEERYEYNITGEMSYELCSVFLTSNKDIKDAERHFYLDRQWQHDKGNQCIEQGLIFDEVDKPIPMSVPLE